MSSNPYAPRDRTNEDISPFWRAFFAVFFCYQLFDRVRKHNADSPAVDTSAGAREDPLSINGTEVRPLASIGITFSDLGYREPGEILRDADLAMYKAKAEGKGRLALFDASLHEQLGHKLQLEADLRHAIGEGQLSLEFQPLFD